MLAIDDILGKLVKVRTHSRGGWQACCPAHDDRRSSLDVAVASSGRVLMYCHAGCSFAAIVHALGLRPADMRLCTVDSKRHSPRQTSPRVFSASYYAPLSLCPPYRLTHGWSYRYANDCVAFCIYRLEGPDGEKRICPVRRQDAPGGGFVFGLTNPPRPLYNLPRIVSSLATVTVIAEGEKAADAIRACGWLATTSVGGAAAASKTDWSPLAGRHVIIWPDNDPPGLQYAKDVRAILLGHKASVETLAPIGEIGDDAADCDDIDEVIWHGKRL